MSRLRVRIELNRGGVGVPLEKLASVVLQSQSFFRMLGDDVHIDQSQGEWLGFDFDHESLNFTAEFVGPVTPEQVAAFHSAFDGTTGLRRATIAQFAHIADAIEEDEVIGFGLYLNEGDDPAEWRCLSRRDALRITEEIRMLLGAGESGQESHLPAVADVNTSARYLFGRRDRGVEAARLAGAVRDVEASLSKRIGRLEGEVADHSSHIQDLRSKSVEAEQSMGRLLSAVEGFCEQAAIRLETVTAPALSAAAAAGASRAPIEGLPKSEGLPKTEALPKTEGLPKTEALSKADALSKVDARSKAEAPGPTLSQAPSQQAPSKDALRAPAPFMAPAPTPLAPSNWWRSPMVLAVGLGTAVILLGMLLWPSSSSPGGGNQVTSASEPVKSTPARNPPVTAPATPAAAPKPVPSAPAPAVPGATRIELEASEPSWIAIRSADGITQVARLIEPGSIQSVDVREPAILRAGNAGGLTVRAHGRSLGPLGPHGAVREVEFKDGEFKLIPVK